MENAENLTNAKRIMSYCNINDEIPNHVCSELKCIGYSKVLKGFRLKTIEGQIVSNADMCDALGTNGILKVYTYSMKKMQQIGQII